MVKIIIKRQDDELLTSLDWFLIIACVLSCFSSVLYCFFYILLFISCAINNESRIKALLLSTTRFILSTAVSVSLPYPILRWILIFGASFSIILLSSVPKNIKQVYNNTLLTVALFSIVASIGSCFNGSYPIVSLAKIFAFFICFIAIMKGIASTAQYRWMDYFALIIGTVFVASVIVIPFSSFRIRNGNFQGIVNQPNMFGILCPLMISAILRCERLANKNKIQTLFIYLILFMCFLSKSRTGMLSSIITLISYFVYSKEITTNKFIIAIIFALIIILLLAFDASLIQIAESFIYKGNSNSFIASRTAQLSMCIYKFQSHKVLGSGFMTPFINGVRSTIFSFNLPNEPGNLFMMLLGDTGVIGLIFFAMFSVAVFRNGEIKNIFILLAVYMINMGEMVFFSTNNIAVFVYLFIAIYLFNYEL